jgi:hypothetical protein
MAEQAWTLIDVRETVEEKTVTTGTTCNVYRRRVAHFTYLRKTYDPNYDWSAHNQITELTGGPYDTRTREYVAKINPITHAVEEMKVAHDKTPWFFAHTYTITSVPGLTPDSGGSGSGWV